MYLTAVTLDSLHDMRVLQKDSDGLDGHLTVIFAGCFELSVLLDRAVGYSELNFSVDPIKQCYYLVQQYFAYLLKHN